MLRLTGLRKTFGALVAVDGVDLEVAPGETLGLLGPNGAGKSTTIKLALGVLDPDAGSVELAGLGSPRDPDVRRRLGYAPQDLAIYEELSADENLRFFGRLQGLHGRDLSRAVDEALALAGLVDRRRDRTGTYSGGMKRRLNLACATLHAPALLLLDEPTAGVDPQSRNHLFESIEALAARGTTIVYTTHYMEEAERLCDRVAIVDHGRVLACDSVDSLLAAHGSQPVVEVELAELPPASAKLPGPIEDGRLRFGVDEPELALAELRAQGLRWRSLRVQRADLETVFLELTGRSLRDA
ncbi:MAG: ABC transporter ATP-binding protein [Planctomycetes bacterium]|nr:ABC transporter ATP-binding protein [Planctomycetota bacterium]